MNLISSLNKMQKRIAPISPKKRIKLSHWKHRTQPSVAGLLNRCQTRQHMRVMYSTVYRTGQIFLVTSGCFLSTTQTRILGTTNS